MTTISTQQVIDYVLEEISKDFNISHTTLVEKYGSIDTISNIIQNKNTKKKVVRRVTKPTVEQPQVYQLIEATVETPKKKVVRKVTKNVVEEPKVDIVVETPVEVLSTVEVPKKKVVRKVTKTPDTVIVVPVEEPKTDPVLEHVEEKVKPQPKRIVKNVTVVNVTVNEEPKKKSKKHVELVEFDTGSDKNSLEGCDELEANVYVDTQIYNDEDSDSLEPREVNGVKYYVDSSNYIYHIETQDLIGKLNEQGDNIIFLSDFSK
jgi:hypothetical protein